MVRVGEGRGRRDRERLGQVIVAYVVGILFVLNFVAHLVEQRKAHKR